MDEPRLYRIGVVIAGMLSLRHELLLAMEQAVEGEFVMSSREWTYRLHGSGVEFTSRAPRLIVDVSEPDFPDQFNTLELTSYFGTLAKGTLLVASVYGAQINLWDSLEAIVDAMVEVGYAERVAHRYALSARLYEEMAASGRAWAR